jgi:hypothetical protein
MARLEIESIEKHEEDKRQKSYDLKLQDGGMAQETADILVVGAALDCSVQDWGRPCAKCEFLHRGLYSLNVRGYRCVRWVEEFSACNCGEPLSLTAAYAEWESL